MKACTVCKEVKSLEEFDRDKRRKDGRVSRCKVCTKAYAAGYYKRNSSRLKAQVQEYRDKNPEKIKEMNRAYKRRIRNGN